MATVKARPVTAAAPVPMTFAPSGPLRGAIAVPGDKSISHRALMLAAVAVGESRIDGLLESDDVRATAAALRAMGTTIGRGDDGCWTVHGVGIGGLMQPADALDMGNAGTAARLLMGLVASHPITATFVGDASLSARPMARVIEPLSLIGADIAASPGGRLPLMVRGLCPAVPITYRLPVASAQIKSAILLAALNIPGITRVIEPVPARDHTERMLAASGADISMEQTDEGTIISVGGEAELRPQHVTIPGDPSSASFPIVAALLVPGSDVTVTGVGVNRTRAGLFDVLRQMGADLIFSNQRKIGGEPVADIRAKHSALRGVDVDPALAPSMIDEFPILFVAAALASGRTVTHGLEELRVKESNRLATMAEALRAIGARVEERPDGLTIGGSSGDPLPGGATVATYLDHRVAMSLAVAGLVSRAAVTLDDFAPVATSFPGFAAALTEMGAS